MGTKIRPEISKTHKYWIDKHRYYELKHFCLQYPIWKDTYYSADDASIPLSMIEYVPSGNLPNDPTARRAIMKVYYSEKMSLIESVAIKADPCIHKYILKAVTEDLSFNYMKSKLDIPCSRWMYYDRYRKFFWLLDQARN